MNTFMNELKRNDNYRLTENGGITHKSSLNMVLDMFGMGAAYRNRSEEDCILLFKNAFEEDRDLALKCLFYLRDCREGQGERRFFRVCYNWLANNYPVIAARNLKFVSEFGRWDDLYCVFNTPIETNALNLIKYVLSIDVQCHTSSLLAKWLPSENASSYETKCLAKKIRKYLKMSSKEYRVTLSLLRERIRVLERLMCANRWDEIEFDKIPSKAGLIYKNAFARRDITAKRYEEFAKSKDTTVNAKVLYPHDIARKAFNNRDKSYKSVDRLMIQKYWDALPDYYNGREENGIAVVDVSGSMCGRPIEAAISLGAYIADKAHGPFANHFITFSEYPQLVRFEGVDIVDKFRRCISADWGMNTNLEAVFDLLLSTAKKKKVKEEDIPNRLYIFSDMEFDDGLSRNYSVTENNVNTLLESIAIKWADEGYDLPEVIFWNLDCEENCIPALGRRFSYVSGFSPNLIDIILGGKNGVELMLSKLESDRYKCIKG